MVRTIVIMLIALAGYAHLFPEDIEVIIDNLKRQLKERMVQRAVLDSANELSQSLYRFARQEGIEPELVDQVLAEHHKVVTSRLESIMLDRISSELDEPEDLN